MTNDYKIEQTAREYRASGNFMEKKRNLICETCGKEFNTNEEIGKHAIEEQHYTFKLLGTNLKLAVLSK